MDHMKVDGSEEEISHKCVRMILYSSCWRDIILAVNVLITVTSDSSSSASIASERLSSCHLVKILTFRSSLLY